MNSEEIRKKFYDFFLKNGHEKISSSPLIPQNDDTLLFANAGMNQFKDYFTGKAQPQNKKAVTIQKCVRAGGKHNDLDNVGHTARHHTFFEMYGNFSFGDYFKKEAIEYSWKFLTQELKIPAEKLFVTVHHSDDEAFELWNKEIGLPAERIFRKGDKDNFWEMGEFGPCGPCSEIFYDHGESYSTPNFRPGANQDILDDELRYVEIWNLVFMQFEKTSKGTQNLPNPSIDTGGGLERLCAVMQGKYWNYDTDLFFPIIKRIEELTGKSYQNKAHQASIRVVADHIRSGVMLITDGVIPSNEGRGYVLRRIIRRAVRHLKELDAPIGTLAQLVPAVFEKFSEEYPQNFNNKSTAEKFLDAEERKFLQTLEIGMKYLDEALDKTSQKKVLSGEAAFMLYDTYGFPLDLTEILTREKGQVVDLAGFEKCMEARKEDSRKSWKGGTQADERNYFELLEKHGASQFIGYESLSHKAKLLDLIDLSDQHSALLFSETPFYPEGGGQLGDTGHLLLPDGQGMVQIKDTKKPLPELILHIIDKTEAQKLTPNTSYLLEVNKEKRSLAARNHSATHLLQAALIKVLGDHVKQAGSSVSPERLRFDFTHMQSLTTEEIAEVENIVNQQIKNSLPVKASVTSLDNALKKGAIAMFGEKYGAKVRVLEMGKFSCELCGGTHVQETSEIGLFKIVQETSLAAGVRRIEALTSIGAFQYLSERSSILKEIEQILKSPSKNISAKVSQLLEENKILQRELKNAKEKTSHAQVKDLFEKSEIVSDIPLVAVEAPEESNIKGLSDHFAQKYQKGLLLLTLNQADKSQVLIRVQNLDKKFNAGLLLNKILSSFGGKGGGRPELAQGSCKRTALKDLKIRLMDELKSLT